MRNSASYFIFLRLLLSEHTNLTVQSLLDFAAASSDRKSRKVIGSIWLSPQCDVNLKQKPVTFFVRSISSRKGSSMWNYCRVFLKTLRKWQTCCDILVQSDTSFIWRVSCLCLIRDLLKFTTPFLKGKNQRWLGPIEEFFMLRALKTVFPWFSFSLIPQMTDIMVECILSKFLTTYTTHHNALKLYSSCKTTRWWLYQISILD